jgi:uncharacterized protein (UPF0332 family)
MSVYKSAYIEYRLSKAQESYTDAKILAGTNSWNACVNRLYYACFYAVSALLCRHQINSQTHSGLKTQFGLHYVKNGKVSKEMGKLFADLMDWRQKGDYGDMFDFKQEMVEPLIEPVGEFIKQIEELAKN